MFSSKIFKALLHNLICLCASFFLSKLIKRKKNNIAIISRDQGKLLDNCKYLFPALHEHLGTKANITFVTQKQDVFNELQGMGLPCRLNKRTIKDIYFFMKVGIVIVDSIDWRRDAWNTTLLGAKIIQLWHGIPLKEIEQAKSESEISQHSASIKLAIRIYWKVTQRFQKFDLLIATSEYAANLLGKCINHKRIWITGYPRNDVLLKSHLTKYDLLNVDNFILNDILRSHASKEGIFFYCPTFRDGKPNPIGENPEIMALIDKYLKKSNSVLYIKLHPWVKSAPQPDITNIKTIPSDTDIYPLLRYADILITDYSSLFFDFLLLDKPIIFFPYDLKEYNASQRSFLLDYDLHTPGDKALTLKGLIRKIAKQKIEDAYIDKRRAVRQLMFSDMDHQSSLRIAKLISEELL